FDVKKPLLRIIMPHVCAFYPGAAALPPLPVYLRPRAVGVERTTGQGRGGRIRFQRKRSSRYPHTLSTPPLPGTFFCRPDRAPDCICDIPEPRLRESQRGVIFPVRDARCGETCPSTAPPLKCRQSWERCQP